MEYHSSEAISGVIITTNLFFCLHMDKGGYSNWIKLNWILFEFLCINTKIQYSMSIGANQSISMELVDDAITYDINYILQSKWYDKWFAVYKFVCFIMIICSNYKFIPSPESSTDDELSIKIFATQYYIWQIIFLFFIQCFFWTNQVCVKFGFFLRKIFS